MSEHTPRPWYTVTGSVWTTPGGPDDGGTHVAMMDRDEPKTTPTERDANARLIAAAPDMLEALKAANIELSELVQKGASKVTQTRFLVVREIIAKAEGK